MKSLMVKKPRQKMEKKVKAKIDLFTLKVTIIVYESLLPFRKKSINLPKFPIVYPVYPDFRFLSKNPRNLITKINFKPTSKEISQFDRIYMMILFLFERRYPKGDTMIRKPGC